VDSGVCVGADYSERRAVALGHPSRWYDAEKPVGLDATTGFFPKREALFPELAQVADEVRELFFAH
jgi:hypothetical protein